MSTHEHIEGMPLQNRVTPWSEIVSTRARYADPTVMFGNRGVLHDDRRNVIRPYASKMWLCCKLNVSRTRKVQRDDNRAFNGRKRILMMPRRYTELFFLDEPTAIAAGHRPCACCRRDDYVHFVDCWSKAFPSSDVRWTASAIDAVLHRERLQSDGKTRKTYEAALSSLPDGVFVSMSDPSTNPFGSTEDGHEPDAWLLWAGCLHHWSHFGYTERLLLSENPARTVRVLTPKSLSATLEAGWQPGSPHVSVHSSACAAPAARKI